LSVGPEGRRVPSCTKPSGKGQDNTTRKSAGNGKREKLKMGPPKMKEAAFGLGPALQSTRRDLAADFRDAAATDRRRHDGVVVQEYEQAAKLRDQLGAARRAMETQEMVLSQPEDLDVIGMAEDDLEAAFQVFFVRGGRVLGRRGWVVDRVEEGPNVEEFHYAEPWEVA